MKESLKQLLLKDLTARLSYGVILDYSFIADNKKRIHTQRPLTYRNIGTVAIDEWHTNDELFKPFLRPMSSMTEEERKEYKHLVAFSGSPDGAANFIDWLNKKMFAYRTIDGKDMFELGIALEAPKEIYNLND